RLLKLDLLGDAHTVVGDGGSTPLLLEHDVAPLRAQRHPHGVGEVVHAPLKAAARLLIERDHLGHQALSSWTLARRPGHLIPAYRPAYAPSSPVWTGPAGRAG